MSAPSDSNENRGSPMHLGISSQFSPEDIQELLGVMGDGGDQHQVVEGEGSSQPGPVVAQEMAGGHPPQATTMNTYTEGGTAISISSSSGPVLPTVPAASAPLAPPPGAGGGGVTAQSATVGEEAKAQARSERKRSREKQRRSDVNKQFADLTQLLQKIDAEDINEEDAKNGTTVNRMTFNPSNRVDLIARTIVLLERLHEANKRRKTEISSLQQQLDEAKKAGEDTAAKLKEAMLAPPGQPMNKQFMMMVPMMMSSDGSGGAVPMMNPYMQQPAMPQPFMQMPAQAMAPPANTATAVAQPAPVANPQVQARAQAPTTAPQPTPSPAPTVVATHPMTAAHPGQQPQQAPTVPHHPGQAAAFQYMMPPMAGARGFMMPVPTPMTGQPMAMMPQAMPTMAMPTRSAQENQNGRQEQKDSSSPGMNHGSNLAHCA